MPIFRRDPDPAESPAPKTGDRSARLPAAARPQLSLIAPGTRVVGQITGGTDVVIEGDLEGGVEIEGSVRVGSEGRVLGELEARVVEIGGKVKGDIVGRERITLGASAELYGDLAAPRVVISEGAFFKGKVEMTGGSRAKRVRGAKGTGREAGSTGGSAGAAEAPEATRGLFAEAADGDGKSGGNR